LSQFCIFESQVRVDDRDKSSGVDTLDDETLIQNRKCFGLSDGIHTHPEVQIIGTAMQCLIQSHERRHMCSGSSFRRSVRLDIIPGPKRMATVVWHIRHVRVDVHANLPRKPDDYPGGRVAPGASRNDMLVNDGIDASHS
jgi:hypothetical protein